MHSKCKIANRRFLDLLVHKHHNGNKHIIKNNSMITMANTNQNEFKVKQTKYSTLNKN